MMKFALSGAFAVSALVLGGFLFSADREAAARPQYNKAFHDTYADNKEAAALVGNAKCNVCHPGANKKMRNDYGESLGKLLGGANVKNEAAIKAALKSAEGEKSGTEGKTFGDLLKDGKLPGKK